MRPALVLASLALLALDCSAADVPKEGTFDYTTCFTRTRSRIDYSPTRFAYSYAETGTTVNEPRGGPFDENQVVCVGMTLSFDGKMSGGSVCEGKDKDGDKRLTRFAYDDEGKLQRQEIAGTGKFDGMATTTTYRPLGPPREIKPGIFEYCTKNTGTYKFK